jgi:hypothetical protein
METLLMIVLLVHAIALLGVFCTARHDVMIVDADGEPVRDWQEHLVPVERPIEAFSRR